jgi:MerR family transcriptional regulator, redox-sensitive transcriptional activator SoxR
MASSGPCATRADSGADLRRLSFALIAQRLGFPLAEIAGHLGALPSDRAPDRHDWERIATGFRERIALRIEALQQLSDKLDGCIGCGCLSLDKCTLYNADDRAARKGRGPRYLMGDPPEETNG